MQPVQYNWQSVLNVFTGSFPIVKTPPPLPNPDNLNPAPTYPPNEVLGIPLTNPIQNTYTPDGATLLPLASNFLSTTVRQYSIELSGNGPNPTSFQFTGIDFMGVERSEIVTFTGGVAVKSTSLFYLYPTSIIPLTTTDVVTVTSVQSSVLGYTAPFITDVFRSQMNISYSLTIVKADADTTITPQYTMANFSSFNNINQPAVNTDPSTISWVNFAGVVPFVGSPVNTTYSGFFNLNTITAMRFIVNSSDETDSSLFFTAKIMQQGAFF